MFDIFPTYQISNLQISQSDFSRLVRRLIAHLELASEDENDTDINADGSDTENDQDPADGEGEGEGDESDSVVDTLGADSVEESDSDVIESDELQTEISDDGELVDGEDPDTKKDPWRPPFEVQIQLDFTMRTTKNLMKLSPRATYVRPKS